MSNKTKNIDFDSIDLDDVDVDKLSIEEYARLLKAKGIAGKGDYTKDRHKWLDKISEEELDAQLRRMSEERKRGKD